MTLPLANSELDKPLVLVVDDDADMLTMLVRLLSRKFDCRVEKAASGDAALAYLDRPPGDHSRLCPVAPGRGNPGPEQLSQDLRVIEKQAKACRKIVSDLLGFSRQVQSAKRDICFNNTIMEATALVRHAFSLDRIEIILELDDRLPIIYADPEKLKQIWINLFGNARDAMPGGGLILVKVSLDSPSQIITVQVADTGSGMAEHELNKIFDPFYSTKPVGQGTGLGLSVSFGIIEDHGGRIRAFSPPPPELYPLNAAGARWPEDIVPGKGTLFVVELPLDFQAPKDGKPDGDD